ncbi:FACT complex subunit SSRP1 [Glycine max]|nr:FACT complex subunit SSRP1 [Glycine max]
MKTLTTTLEGKADQAVPQWIEPKSHVQTEGYECGYYVMHWMWCIVSGSLKNEWNRIDYVEFERHVAGGSNMHYFDLSIRLKSEQEHLCCNIQRNEYHNLYEFIRRCLTYCWYKEGSLFEDDDVVDPHLERIKNEAGGDESDEEKPAKKESKKDMPSKASTSKRKSKDDEDGKKKKRLKCTQEDNVWFHVHF